MRSASLRFCVLAKLVMTVQISPSLLRAERELRVSYAATSCRHRVNKLLYGDISANVLHKRTERGSGREERTSEFTAIMKRNEQPGARWRPRNKPTRARCDVISRGIQRFQPRDRERKNVFRGLWIAVTALSLLLSSPVIEIFDRRLLTSAHASAFIKARYGAAKISKRNSSIRRTRADQTRSFPGFPASSSSSSSSAASLLRAFSLSLCVSFSRSPVFSPSRPKRPG